MFLDVRHTPAIFVRRLCRLCTRMLVLFWADALSVHYSRAGLPAAGTLAL